MIWLLRHGMRQDFEQADWFQVAERPHDPPLSANGRQQAKETGEFLRNKGIERIYCSPFLRTVDTAGIIASVLDVPVYVEYGLCEVLKEGWFPGQPEYLSMAAMHQLYPHVDPHYLPLIEPQYPENEEAGELDERCRNVTAALLADTWHTTLLVGHGASVGGVAKQLCSATAQKLDYFMCGLHQFTQADGQWALGYSGTEHLSITEETVRFH